MKITWYGHSAFRIEAGDARILIDPFLSGNPAWDGGWEAAAEGITHVLLTHGHADHLGDSAAILKQSGAMLVANFEICMYLVGQGIAEDKINPGNLGGTVDCGGFTTTFVQAQHSSSFPLDDGTNVYLGNPGGLILHFPREKTLYHMGDTDIFGDMALIQELHRPQIGLVPIGDRFTMGGAVAALACRRFFQYETVIPCHYASFPIVDQSADKFIEGMKGTETNVLVPERGAAVEL
ncbi:metal-dependent hydrolase [Chelativorans sp. M5D2P16]|uniref:metal-dependent hydrolase n=1 Tax=Chelativorans sp. M5D2P16 TaxID=3095678 RepID=UPI002ACAD017|nr:metal-dependent hydrolase [Chelativorans sp. M5D2P16]MDZ5696380.1 metal-dependent hydrolase [Chelativorans sp. M5D2P16]